MDSKYSNLFFKAVKLAAEAHHEQRRKSTNDAYIVHPMRVAYLAIDAGLPIDACIAAILHDVVEDTPVTLQDLCEDGYSAETVQIVALLSKWWPEGTSKDDKAPLMKQYFNRLVTNQQAINIKLLDRVDNLRDMERLLSHKTGWAKKQIEESEGEGFQRLYSLCDTPAIQEAFKDVVNRIKQRIERIESRSKDR
jgi:GTP pyrophosphokinase